ncbi:DUF4190 domain-containing protein [Geodermatophilus sp. CPCC 206100]|uniref:DUF4190 domain-containing protein n=1 Tax=Geodermatophilus sp. CPCC 206100 TaxID=3020054 RepID=UPI003AFF7A1C
MTHEGPQHAGADETQGGSGSGPAYGGGPVSGGTAWTPQTGDPAPYGGTAWTPQTGNPASYGGQQPAPYGSYPAGPGAPYGQPPAGPFPGAQVPYGYPYAPPQRTNGLAIASMVLGILWIYWIGSILALVFGYVARKQIRERGDSGDGMAIAGIVLGWVGVGILTIALIAAIGTSV